MDAITELCSHDGYRHFADGTPATVALPAFDEELLEQGGIPVELLDEPGALLLEPGTLARLGVAVDDLIGLRLTDDGLTLEPVAARADTAVGACAEDPDLFTTPLAPLSEIADEHGLARSGGWLAPTGFDFARWDFERRCERLAARYDLGSDDALVLTTLIAMHSQMAWMLDIAADDDAELDGGDDL